MTLSVLRHVVDGNPEFRINGFAEFADNVCSSKSNRCDECGFSSQRFMRLVSVKGNYSVLTPDNFIVCCPLCFMAHRMEHAKDRAVIAYIPELTQSQINMICHVLWHFSAASSLNTTQYHYANDTINNLLKRTDIVDIALGNNAHLPENFAAGLKAFSDNEYESRHAAFGDLRLIPLKSAFQLERDYWAQSIYPRLLGTKPENWNSLSSAIKKVMPDVELPG